MATIRRWICDYQRVARSEKRKTYAHATDDQGVLFGLAFETGLEAVLLRIDNEDGEVGLGHACDHIGDEVSVTRGIQDGEARLLSLERDSGNIDRNTAASLFVGLVHEPCKGEGRLANRLCLLSQFPQRSFIDNLQIVEQATHECALTVVDVACKKISDPFILLQHELRAYQ